MKFDQKRVTRTPEGRNSAAFQATPYTRAQPLTYDTMILLKSAMLTLALAGSAFLASNDEGQGTAQPGTHVSDLRMGTYLLGPGFDTEEMLGKVLVVEIGGG